MNRTDLISLLEEAQQDFVEIEIGGHYFDISGTSSVLRGGVNGYGLLALKSRPARELISKAHFTEALFEERERRITKLEEQYQQVMRTIDGWIGRLENRREGA